VDSSIINRNDFLERRDSRVKQNQGIGYL